MGRPRSNNLKIHLDWALSTNAFSATYSFLDSVEYQKAHAKPDQPCVTSRNFKTDPQLINGNTFNGSASSNSEKITNSLPTPPSHSANVSFSSDQGLGGGGGAILDSDSDSDLEYLAHLSEPSKSRATFNASVPKNHHNSNNNNMGIVPHSKDVEAALLPSAKEDIHIIDTSSGPNTPQHFHGSPESDQTTTTVGSQPFRFSQAVIPADVGPPRQEIGSVFSEKIALLEQKINLLTTELTSRNIYCDTHDIDGKIREVDRRIEEFPGADEDEIMAAGPYSELNLSSSPKIVHTSNDLPIYINNDQLDSDFVDNFNYNDISNNHQQQQQQYGQNSDYDDNGDDNDDDNDIEILNMEPRPNIAGRNDDYEDGGDDGGDDDEDDDDDLEELSHEIMEPNLSGYFQDDSEIIGTEPMQLQPPPSQQFSVPIQPPSQQPASTSTTKAWTKEMMHTLRTRFGLQGFRPNQSEAVNETLAGNDVVVLMPTGGGKSLCYQLPALVTTGSTQGTTVVISPLISLMQDQVYHLKNRNIQAEMLNSKLNATERSAVFSLLNSGELQLLYISPEMLSASSAMQSSLRRLYLNNRLARIVIDEAHCVSSWGHDFRPEYMELTKVKEEFPATPIMALTATANERVLLDIVGCLRSNPIVLKQSFNRHNLYYEVRPKTSTIINDISTICKMYRGKSGIIYCHSKRNCEETATKLRQNGIAAEFYHAGMTQEVRASVQQSWQKGECSVVCATIAFGMGIDKPDVRYVMHMTLPRNIEGYYQETGRAGRDGKPSHCILFYSYRDVQMLQKMINQDTQLSAQIREHHRTLLRRVMQYCENKTDCRRQQVLQYFNEDFNPQYCRQQCDNCRNMKTQGVVHKDMTNEAKQIVTIVQQISAQHITTQQVTDVLLGRKTRKSKSCGFDNMPWFGIFHSMGPLLVERLVHALISERIIEEYSQYNHSRYPQSYIKIGQNAWQLTNGQMPVRLSMPRDAEAGAAVQSRNAPTSSRNARGTSNSTSSKNNNVSSSSYKRKARPSRFQTSKRPRS